MNSATTMNGFSRKAVESFVQTVVLVDDKIYAPPPLGIITDAKKASPPKARKTAVKSAETLSEASVDQIDEAELEHPFSPHDIQASFAKNRIVCSLHQPRKDCSVGLQSDAYKLCASADIVIVDWDLYGDDGVKATDLIENLVVQSLVDDPHQLRLVLIYTDNPNLFDVADRVSEQLSKKIPDGIEYKAADEGLAFHTSNARVVVLGKPATRLEKFKAFEVSEHDLADRAIEEYCKLADGLLQASILFGLAAIRNQSRKILTKFHSGLDAAFLTHRALGLPHEEAFDHVIPLLVSEIEAALEDGMPSPVINKSVVEDWCKGKWEVTKHAAVFVSSDADPKKFAQDFCTLGMNIKDKYPAGKSSDLKKTIKDLTDNSRWPSKAAPAFKSLASYLSADLSGNDLRELSVLMSQRTFYGEERHMTLGTLIRETTGEQRYFLCLQPVCDCVRLSKPVTFVFSVLEVTEKDMATHVVSVDNSFDDLVYRPSIESCVTIKFRPEKGSVLANSSVFESETGEQFDWIAQLKPAHAQRAAEQFARVLGRVGLTESEWLRLKAK